MLAQWSPENSEFSRAGVAVRYRDDNRHVVETAYRYRRGLLEQTDLTVMTPVYRAISLAGRWRYSLRDDQSLDTYVGLRYDTCCWAADVAFRRYISDSRRSEEHTSELQSLMRISYAGFCFTKKNTRLT